MCRLFAMTNLEGVKVNQPLLNAIKTVVCFNQNDGFGYAVSDGETLSGERYVVPKMFYKMNYTQGERMKHPAFKQLHNSFGTSPAKRKIKALIAHGRTSTNDVTLAATHPFLNGDSSHAFAHNGVVTVPCKHDLVLQTKNDSEYLAHLWWKEGKSCFKDISGYFAFLDLLKNGEIHIAKDDRAFLYASFITLWNTYIVCTAAEGIESFCTIMKVKHSSIVSFEDNTYCIFKGLDLVSEKFEKKAVPTVSTWQQERAFGNGKHYEPSAYARHFRSVYGDYEEDFIGPETAEVRELALASAVK